LDSRVPTEIVFDQGIGDIFVGRVAGNFVNTDMLGSFEFGTAVAGAKVIVVLGHSSCGAIMGAIDQAELGNLTSTLANIEPAVRAAGRMGDRSSGNTALVERVTIENVQKAMDDITARSPVLAGLVADGKLLVVGGVYDLATGEITWLDS
jgi:carbonic anhydrase